MKRICMVLLSAAILAAPVTAQDIGTEAAGNWHQWRGPTGNGVAISANPPSEWSETKNVKWKVQIPGKGSSTPIIWNDKVFILSAVKTEKMKEEPSRNQTQPIAVLQDTQQDPPRRRGRGERRGRGGGGAAPKNYYEFAVICYNRATGEEVWKTVAAEAVPHEAGHGTNTFASSSPTTDGQHVYASFGSRGVFCFDMDGNQKWTRNFGEMRTAAGFGEGSSPALHGDTLVVPWDHEGDSFLVALDKKTGEDKWRVKRDERTTWATPLIVNDGQRTQVITNGKVVRSYDLANGELLWECGGQASNPIPSPVLHDKTVYCMTGYRGYAIYAIPLDAKGDITDSDKVTWSATEAAPYVPSPVLYKGQLYFTKSRNGVLLSRDAVSGDLLIKQTRLPGIDSMYASLVAAGDRIFATGRNGTTLVLKHGKEFEVLATNELDDAIDASPAIVGNEIFLRGDKHLYCIAAK
ncbi:PQQ-binding-like beta-propeller repeat protein [Planctomycetota bacterium]